MTNSAIARRCFDDLHRELTGRCGEGDDWYNPGLTAQQIMERERALGLTLPDDYRAFLQLFDGFSRSDPMSVYIPNGEGQIVWESGLGIEPFAEVLATREFALTGMLYGDYQWPDDACPGAHSRPTFAENRKWFPIGFGDLGEMWYYDFSVKPRGEVCFVAPHEFFTVISDSYGELIRLITLSIRRDYDEAGNYRDYSF